MLTTALCCLPVQPSHLIAVCITVESHEWLHCHDTCSRQQRLWVQGLVGTQICQQLGQEAIDSAVTQTAGLLPRDLQALAADAAAAAAARGLNTSHMLPHVRAPQAPNVNKLLQEEPQSQAGPVSIWGRQDSTQSEGPKRQLEAAEGQQGDPDGQQAGLDGQGDSKEIVQVSGADVQASLDRVRLRTATVIGAPKVSLDEPTTAYLLCSAPLSSCFVQDHAVLLPDCADMLSPD